MGLDRVALYFALTIVGGAPVSGIDTTIATEYSTVSETTEAISTSTPTTTTLKPERQVQSSAVFSIQTIDFSKKKEEVTPKPVDTCVTNDMCQTMPGICHRGTCISTKCDISCVCEAGFTGQFCDRNITEVQKVDVTIVNGKIMSTPSPTTSKPSKEHVNGHVDLAAISSSKLENLTQSEDNINITTEFPGESAGVLGNNTLDVTQTSVERKSTESEAPSLLTEQVTVNNSANLITHGTKVQNDVVNNVGILNEKVTTKQVSIQEQPQEGILLNKSNVDKGTNNKSSQKPHTTESVNVTTSKKKNISNKKETNSSVSNNSKAKSKQNQYVKKVNKQSKANSNTRNTTAIETLSNISKITRNIKPTVEAKKSGSKVSNSANMSASLATNNVQEVSNNTVSNVDTIEKATDVLLSQQSGSVDVNKDLVTGHALFDNKEVTITIEKAQDTKSSVNDKVNHNNEALRNEKNSQQPSNKVKINLNSGNVKQSTLGINANNVVNGNSEIASPSKSNMNQPSDVRHPNTTDANPLLQLLNIIGSREFVDHVTAVKIEIITKPNVTEKQSVSKTGNTSKEAKGTQQKNDQAGNQDLGEPQKDSVKP